MGRRHPDHGLVEAVPARRAAKRGVAVAEDAAVGADQVVAVARDGAQRTSWVPLGPVTSSVAVKTPSDGGVKVSGMLQVSRPAGRSRAAEMEDALPADLGRRDVHALARGPQLDEEVCEPPGRTDALMPSG